MADNTTARAAVLVISTAAEHRVRGCAETANTAQPTLVGPGSIREKLCRGRNLSRRPRFIMAP